MTASDLRPIADDERDVVAALWHEARAEPLSSTTFSHQAHDGIATPPCASDVTAWRLPLAEVGHRPMHRLLEHLQR